MEIHCSKLKPQLFWVIIHASNYTCVFRGNVAAPTAEQAVIRVLTHITANPRTHITNSENLV